jgi:hypothetical protein
MGDLHTVEPAWGVDDEANHGTGLAGLAAYGDLTDALSSANSINVPHRLESVKLVPAEGANEGDARHHAYLFIEGVARPEISAPHRTRVFTSAVTASDYRDRGRPSSWSAAVDGLAADTDGAESPRLFVLSAGNTRSPMPGPSTPTALPPISCMTPARHGMPSLLGPAPTRSTRRDMLLESRRRGRRPQSFTTTTRTWDRAWPLKPEVVLEGGNAAKNEFGAVGMSSLNLLTTHHQPLDRLFTTSNATSAASALCAGMAAQIMAAYPHLRPETVRALLVHSAQWSETMRGMFLPADRMPNKGDYVHLIRHCGWGTPDLNRALWSAGDSLTLLVEDQVHPYAKVPVKGVVTRDMNLHSFALAEG